MNIGEEIRRETLIAEPLRLPPGLPEPAPAPDPAIRPVPDEVEAPVPA